MDGQGIQNGTSQMEERSKGEQNGDANCGNMNCYNTNQSNGNGLIESYSNATAGHGKNGCALDHQHDHSNGHSDKCLDSAYHNGLISHGKDNHDIIPQSNGLYENGKNKLKLKIPITDISLDDQTYPELASNSPNSDVEEEESPCNNIEQLTTDSGSGEDVDDGAVSPLSPPKTPTKSYPPKSPRRRARTMSTSSSAQSSQVVQAGARTIYTAGRPPWYDSHGQLKEAFVIGICGGSASGKTTVAKRIIEALDVQWVSLLSMDSFYKNFDESEREKANRNEYNFDHPDAFDYQLVIETLQRLKEGKSVEVPVYNFKTHSREKQKKTIYGANVVIFEGILAFANKDLLPILDMKIFVDTDSDIRLARRLKRDISERGREIEGVLKQYNKFVKPSFEHYIEPTMTYADIIVPRGGENEIALNLIVNHVHQQLQKRGFKVRSQLKKSAHEGQPLPKSLHVLENTKQVQGLHTFIRNKDTCRDEFIFYSKRLMRLLIEFALSLLPFSQIVVDTPQGIPYRGKKTDVKTICGVSVLRAGETMEPALSEVVKDIRLGKILIQTNHDTGEPELHYLRLPRDIKEHHVMVMDATVATGAAAMMAIRVLLDHDVLEENIMLLSLIMAESGVHSVAYAFPKVRLITTAVDPEVNDSFHILPGIGNFGDRYFGTEMEHGAIIGPRHNRLRKVTVGPTTTTT